MRKILFIALALLLACCSGGDFIRSRAEHFVRRTYPDVDRILYYSVDTITLGDNMKYRIEQAQRLVKEAGWRDKEAGWRDKEDLDRETARLHALDSLLAATPQDVIDTPTAFQCCIAYNVPSNLVWVQLDTYGNLLQISKDMMQLYLNPGEDIPGYFEVNKRFSRY